MAKSRLFKSFMAPVLAAAPLVFGAGTTAADPLAYKEQGEAEANFQMYCRDQVMGRYTAQESCMQQTYGQTLNFARKFFEGLGINSENKFDKIGRWKEMAAEKHKGNTTAADQDVLSLITYGKTCAMLEETIMNPHAVLDQSYGIDTRLSLPEHCVNSAIELGTRYGIPFDATEAARLQVNFKQLRDYYTRNPEIPSTRPGETKNLPQPV